MSQVPAIVVVAFNRPQALQGLLNSLLKADYNGHEVPLVISIDGGRNKPVATLADSFVWPFGTKKTTIYPSNLGLKQHILKCGALAKEYGSIVLLEDDLEVAPGFYIYALKALSQYNHEPIVGGISLYSYAISESSYEAFATFPDGKEAYLMQFPSSWGQAWTAGQWQLFELWQIKSPPHSEAILPPFVRRWGNKSWKKIFLQYLMEEGKYFVYPKTSFSTNKGYAGAHFAMHLSLFDVPLSQTHIASLPPIAEMQRFDAHFEMEQATLERLAGVEFNGSVKLNLYNSRLPSTPSIYFIEQTAGISTKPIPKKILQIIESFSGQSLVYANAPSAFKRDKPVRVEDAEYHWQAKRKNTKPSTFKRRLFLLRYNLNRYLNVILQQFRL